MKLYPIESVSQANEITGGLSYPEKMPGAAYNLPATACNVGARLAAIEGTVCHSCYALKGRYRFPVVQDAMARRLKAIRHRQWVDGMVYLIGREPCKYFRWHDSGDLQSARHLRKIVRVAERLPAYSFWLPTRELRVVRSYRQRYGNPPSNLLIRVSLTSIDDEHRPDNLGFPTSSVTTGEPTCPAHKQDNKCGSCRMCWDPGVRNVSYGLH